MLIELQIFAARLKQARILKKLSMDKLAEAMAGVVTKQAISKYESAKMMPNSTVLIALATALGVDIDYFFRPFSFDVNTFQVSFRKKSDTSAKDVNALKVQIQDQIERYLEVEEILGKVSDIAIPSDNDVLSTPSQMCEKARKVREEWNLGSDAIANVQDVLEARGIKVITTDAPEGFDGVSGIVNNKDMVIVLNGNRKHVERRRFTAMHELGHLLYDRLFASNLTQREKERLCDAFASEMLLPTSVIAQNFQPDDKISTSELKKLQMEYGISADAIMHKLKELEYISESRYKLFCIRKGQNESLKKFIEDSCFTENLSNRFETMVYSAAAKDLISTSKAAAMLNTSITTVRKHLNVI